MGSVTRLTITEWPETAVATFSGLYFLRFENVADRARNQRRVHDGAVHHGILRQRFQTKTHQFIALFGALQLDGFDRARADVQTHQSLVFCATKHVETPLAVPTARLLYPARPNCFGGNQDSNLVEISSNTHTRKILNLLAVPVHCSCQACEFRVGDAMVAALRNERSIQCAML